MTIPAGPVLDPADADAALADLLGRIASYVPGLVPAQGGAAWALTQVVAQYRESVNRRLNAVPGKSLLAFLDLMGMSLVAPRAARAPVVFAFRPPSAPSYPETLKAMLAAQGTPMTVAIPLPPPPIAVRVPAGTNVAANDPDGGLPLIFETEQDIGLTSGSLSQVLTLWPGRDCCSDLSSDVGARRPAALFDEVTAVGTPHALYLGHEDYLALRGTVAIMVEIDLIAPGSLRLDLVWETWDGQAWRAFGDPDVYVDPEAPPSLAATVDGTLGLTRSGVVILRGDCVETKPTEVNGLTAHWLRARSTNPLPPDPSRIDARLGRVRLSPLVSRLIAPTGLDPVPLFEAIEALVDDPGSGVTIDAAMADGQPVDLSRPFQPFGGTPTIGSEFAWSSDEVLSRPGADVRLAAAVRGATAPSDVPRLSWQWFDGLAWNDLAVVGMGDTNPNFLDALYLGFTVPEGGIPRARWRGQEGRWVRAVVRSGAYAVVTSVSVPDSPAVEIARNVSPIVLALRLAYVYQPPRAFPEQCLATNDFAFEDHTRDARRVGAGFVPFRAVTDSTPALYLGFDQPFPADLVSLYIHVAEGPRVVSSPPLIWEIWDGALWIELTVRDETANLARPGMIDFVGSPESPRLARFGGPWLWWIRGRLRTGGDPLTATLVSIDVNAVWASQTQTIQSEVLGSGTGEPGQSFFAARSPVLGGEVIEVRELDGARAAIELPILARQVDPADLNVVSDALGRVREVWVRWREVSTLDLSGPTDRHYVTERTRGRFLFGNRVHGRAAPPGRDNVVARRYQTGGGASGNVAAGAIKQLLAGLPFVSGVINPVAAEGGADGETLDAIRLRGPETLRHRGRALAARDYEALAREASPAVAVARAIPAVGPDGLPAAGWVTIVIMPRSQGPQPQPSLGLRTEVHRYLTARAPADLAGLAVIGPSYRPIGVNLTVVPVRIEQAGPVGMAARQTVEAFLHPLTGGPDGQGWPLGRDVYLSDVAVAVAATPGLDHATGLELTIDGIPQGETVAVPPGQIVVAGTIRVRVMSGGQTC